jgi:predicted ATPase/DNA-binding XRE family transcriptional regulator
MKEAPAGDFGTLLRTFRASAGLSQEELAERARISVQAVSALERGFRKNPYRETIRLLAEALALGDLERGLLETAGKRPTRVSAEQRSETPAFPTPATGLVGREATVLEIEALVREARLVTLLGTGGVGKTRIALEIGERARTAGTAPVAFVDLSPLTSAEFVVSRIAATLGVHERRGGLLATLAESLAAAKLLLILDNCEHVVDEAARVAAFLLSSCPGVTILGTSREALGIPGERIYRLPSLTFPARRRGNDGVAAADWRSYGAVELFVERATSVDGGFALTERNAPVVAEICRRLDGIPLAIELAAMRTSVLGVERLAAKLDDRFRLLAGGSRVATPRQQTMRALIDWSYDLLSDAERRAFRALAIFAGGWTLEAAAAVCFGGPDNELDALDALVSLADKSLVVVESGAHDKRYRMLETIREYGLGVLRDAGEYEEFAARHAGYFTDVAEEAAESWGLAPESVSIAGLEPELDNFRAAFAWSTNADGHITARLAAALWRFWQFQVELTEGLGWLERGLAVSDPAHEPELVASLLLGKAFLLPYRDQLAAAEPAVAAYRALGDERRLATALMKLGDALWAAGRLPDAETALEEALEVARRTGRARSIATVLTQLATVRSLRGDLTGARASFAAVLELVEGASASEELAGSHAVALTNLAEVEFNAGSVARAIELAARALELSRNQGDRRNMSLLCCNLAGYLARDGRFDEARAPAREALDLLAEDRQSFLVASAVESLAHAAIAAGDAARAARLAGFAEARRTALGAAREAGESENFERLMRAINAVLEGATADALLSEGSRLSVDEAVRLALEG